VGDNDYHRFRGERLCEYKEKGQERGGGPKLGKKKKKGRGKNFGDALIYRRTKGEDRYKIRGHAYERLLHASKDGAIKEYKEKKEEGKGHRLCRTIISPGDSPA